MSQLEAAKEVKKSDEGRVRMRQETEEACAGDLCKRKSNGRDACSAICGRDQAEELFVRFLEFPAASIARACVCVVVCVFVRCLYN